MHLAQLPFKDLSGVGAACSQLLLDSLTIFRMKDAGDRATQQLVGPIAQIARAVMVDRQDHAVGTDGEIHGGIVLVEDPIGFFARFERAHAVCPFLGGRFQPIAVFLPGQHDHRRRDTLC